MQGAAAMRVLTPPRPTLRKTLFFCSRGGKKKPKKKPNLNPSAGLHLATEILQMEQRFVIPALGVPFKWWGKHENCSLTAPNSFFFEGKSNDQLPKT